MAKSTALEIDMASVSARCAESSKAIKEVLDKMKKDLQKQYFAAGDHKAWAEEIATNAAILYDADPFLSIKESIIEAAMTFFKEMSE